MKTVWVARPLQDGEILQGTLARLVAGTVWDAMIGPCSVCAPSHSLNKPGVKMDILHRELTMV